jgi:carboxylesterase
MEREKTLAQSVKGVITRPKGASVAILLVHGFAASSDELATLGEYLGDEGYASFAVQLAGHGTTPESLKATTWQDWYHSALKGLEEIRAWNPDRIILVGLSMGGLLSILMASEEDVDGLVLIAPALKIPGLLFSLVPILKYVIKWRDVDIEAAQKVYDVKRFKLSKEPVSAYHELYKLQKVARDRMRHIKTPTLIIQGTDDKTIDPRSGEIAYNGILSEKKKLHMIEGAEHVITCHPTRHQVYPLILKFIQDYTG